MRRDSVVGPFLPQDGCSEGHYTGSVKIQADDPGVEWERRIGQKKKMFSQIGKKWRAQRGFSGRLIVSWSGAGWTFQ